MYTRADLGLLLVYSKGGNMIWIHTYGVGPFKKNVLRKIHESEESALASQKVLGGTIQCYMKKPQGFDLV